MWWGEMLIEFWMKHFTTTTQFQLEMLWLVSYSTAIVASFYIFSYWLHRFSCVVSFNWMNDALQISMLFQTHSFIGWMKKNVLFIIIFSMRCLYSHRNYGSKRFEYLFIVLLGLHFKLNDVLRRKTLWHLSLCCHINVSHPIDSLSSENPISNIWTQLTFQVLAFQCFQFCK